MMKYKNVLIVEDDIDIREVISLVLTGDYQLTMCSSARALNAEISKALPDVIVLDIMLPDGNGVDLCQRIKSDPLSKHVPILLMSAHKNESTLESGADAFIAKPFNIKSFRSLVESFL
ncbi:response regulator transcription factor [Niabella ginsengisoli]|uniref:Response regulator n=1 Tax=Niabella ginsengisoli TaxID=522298 RepID=A0ABS9SH95_9BACT|nr:response regulator [Niabella ginsengisoli]MCH5597529.1 response regulator [Niabella ginsengisoli]